MNNFFEGLANQQNAEITWLPKKDTSTLQSNGILEFTKGILSFDVNYWANVYSYRYDGYIVIEDADWDISKYYIDGVKIDNITSFKDGLKNMGLGTIANTFEVKNDEILNAVYHSIANSESVSAIFPNKKVYNLLRIEEKQKIVLDYSIVNYDKANPWELNNLGLSESPNTLPSLEQLIEIKNNLNK